MHTLIYHEIESIDDNYYDSWLDLYQVSFPLTEQMKIGDLNRMLRRRSLSENGGDHLVSVLDESGVQVGIVLYSTNTGCAAAVLWYLAVAHEHRSLGLGSAIYTEVVERIIQEPTIDAVLLEVEDPDTTPQENRPSATSRIEFYRRNGARLLNGIGYTQSVGWQPPVEMRIMVHAKGTLSAQEAYDLARTVFGDAVQQRGELILG